MRVSTALGVISLLVGAAASCGDDESASSTVANGGSPAASSSSSGASGGSTSSSGSASGGQGGSGGQADPCADRLVCDDFESHTLGMAPHAPWEILESTGSVLVDDSRAYSGALSVKVSTDGSAGFTRALIRTSGAPAFPLPGNVMYGRMMFYAVQAANDGVHWTHIEGRGPLSGMNGVTSMYRYGGQHMGRLMANYETSGLSTDCWHHSQTALPTGQWACMEWRFDGPNSRMQLWIDGTEISDLDVMGAGMGCIGNDLNGQWPAPDFEEIRLGWESYQADAPREAWIDDVIIDDQPIGCP